LLSTALKATYGNVGGQKNVIACSGLSSKPSTYFSSIQALITSRLDVMLKALAVTVKDEMKIATVLSLTSDNWTSGSNDAYISVTTSFINDDWQLVNCMLANEPMEERHTATHIAAHLLASAKK